MEKNLSFLYEVAQSYRETFIDKQILFTYRDINNARKELTVICSPENFMHLCGVKTYASRPNTSSKNALVFYKHCVSYSLNPLQCRYEAKELDLKLKAMKHLSELMCGNTKICNKGMYLKLSFDKAIRSNKQLVAFGLIQGNNLTYKPNSCMNLSDFNKSKSASLATVFKVTKILVKDNKDNILSEIIPPSATPKKYKKRKIKKH